MNATLQSDRDSFANILRETLHVAERYFADGQSDLPPGKWVDDLLPAVLPEKGHGAAEVLKQFEHKYAKQITNSAGPRYFGFVTGGSTPASVAGDWLVSTYDQNACGSNDSIAPQIEHQTIDFIRQLLGIDKNFFGSFVTGATVSNMVGLALGRQWIGEQQGIDFSNDGITGKVKVLSGTPHSSILKSLSMLGIGRKSLSVVKTLDGREAVDIAQLEDALASHHGPVIVVANAGTVNTVDFDDLLAIGKLKAKYSFWLHVDAAFGGFAGISPMYKHLVDGINLADSITIDAHKWLNVPYDAAMQFTKHKALQLKVFQNAAAYLSDPQQSPDFFHYTPETSRRFRALPAWFSLMAYGREGHREIVERNCAMASRLGEWIDQSEKYTLLAPVRMNVVCFTLAGDKPMSDIKVFLDRVRDDGRVFFTPTSYKGTPGIRAAVSNWLTSENDINITIEALNQLA
ncbi:MAG TPA: pyridoxal-dependent decarboxylase [Cyclobacteriaceae bacterium]|nr:pyridoxal-dependent decarboxylase [Cyclobacteriaceae bacterium]